MRRCIGERCARRTTRSRTAWGCRRCRWSRRPITWIDTAPATRTSATAAGTFTYHWCSWKDPVIIAEQKMKVSRTERRTRSRRSRLSARAESLCRFALASKKMAVQEMTSSTADRAGGYSAILWFQVAPRCSTCKGTIWRSSWASATTY